MGTRHLTIVKGSGKVFGQYGQWDGYPDGAGIHVFNFVKSFDEEKFTKQFAKVKFLTDDEVKARWKAAGADGTGLATMAVADKFKEKDAQLSHDMGSGILEYIADAESPEVHDGIKFAADSLFCEWAWMVDLDAHKLVCFKGFNCKPLEEGEFFKHLENSPCCQESRCGDGSRYYPVKFDHEWTFDQIKHMTDSDFLAVFDGEE